MKKTFILVATATTLAVSSGSLVFLLKPTFQDAGLNNSNNLGNEKDKSKFQDLFKNLILRETLVLPETPDGYLFDEYNAKRPWNKEVFIKLYNEIFELNSTSINEGLKNPNSGLSESKKIDYETLLSFFKILEKTNYIHDISTDIYKSLSEIGAYVHSFKSSEGIKKKPQFNFSIDIEMVLKELQGEELKLAKRVSEAVSFRTFQKFTIPDHKNTNN